MAVTTGGQSYYKPESQTLEYRHERNRDHGETDSALGRRVRQFRGFRDKGHHDEIRADDGHVLKPEAQEMRPGQHLVQRIYQIFRPLWSADCPCLHPHLSYSGYGATTDTKF